LTEFVPLKRLKCEPNLQKSQLLGDFVGDFILKIP